MFMVKQEISDKRKSKIVGASQGTAAKKETKKRFQNATFQRKETAKAERAPKMAERESIKAAAAIERKQKKDQTEWDNALLVEDARGSAAQATRKVKK
jgi:hypothetical protein